MNRNLQYRCRGPVNINTTWQWKDVPENWYNMDGNLYLSSVGQLTHHCDIEFREKPAFVPGWFRRYVSSGQITLEYCNTREPIQFAGQWQRVEEGDMDDLLGFNVD